MPSSRSLASPNQSIELVVAIRDSAGDLGTASGVSTYIFDPSGNHNLLVTAIDTLTPTTPSAGVFVADYTIPANATEGTWYDRWMGWLDGQPLDEVFQFTVVASGIVETTVLQNNNVIIVTLDKDIADEDGNTLGDTYSSDPNYEDGDYSFYFTTHYTPTYTNYNQIMLNIGRYISNIAEDTVWRLILSASLDADRYAMRTPGTSNEDNFFSWARRNWVRCKVEEMVLVESLQEFDIKRKRLGDLDVTWNTEGIGTALERSLACQEKWMPGLESGGIKVKKAQHFIKGYDDPDKPSFGRESITTDDTADPYRGYPAANSKYFTNTYYRRTKKGYSKRWN